jgi:signal transduction histidine kinase
VQSELRQQGAAVGGSRFDGRLSAFILRNIEPILQEWEAFARSLAAGTKMDQLALRDDAESILRAVVRDMQSNQTLAQQASKSKGHGGAGGVASDRLDSASTLHGAARVGSGFDLIEVVSEYRALRASVLRLWRASNPEPDVHDLDDITRFNECVDQSLARAVASYTARVDQTRRMFLAILAHDLRNPVNTISLSARLASHNDSIPPDSKEALSQIETSVQAIDRLIRDLTDFAATGLGAAMPITPAPANLDALCREVTRETEAAHPRRRIICDSHGDLTVVADAARIRQVISNLLGNAIQHDSSQGVVKLSLAGEESEVTLSVHNGGAPIPADRLATIFDPLVRGDHSPAPRRPGSIGLGLYIVREIVTAHGGRVELTSSESEGTRFTVHIPRRPVER